MAKVTSIREKQDEKLAMELLKEIRKTREFFDFTGEKLTPHLLGLVVKDKLNWWAM